MVRGSRPASPAPAQARNDKQDEEKAEQEERKDEEELEGGVQDSRSFLLTLSCRYFVAFLGLIDDEMQPFYYLSKEFSTSSPRGLRVMDKFSKSDPMCVLYKKVSRGRPAVPLPLPSVECGETGRRSVAPKPSPTLGTRSGRPALPWNTSFTRNRHQSSSLSHLLQSLRFAVFDVDDDSGELDGQDRLGTAECSLAQLLAGSGHKVVPPPPPPPLSAGDASLPPQV